MKFFWIAIVCIVIITVLAVIYLPDSKKHDKHGPVLTERESQEAKHDLEWMDSELRDDEKIDSLEQRYRDTIIKLRMNHMNKYFTK